MILTQFYNKEIGIFFRGKNCIGRKHAVVILELQVQGSGSLKQKEQAFIISNQ